MASYEGLPVFRSTLDYSPESLIGRAKIDIDEEKQTSTITIETIGTDFVEFVLMGDLKALGLNAIVYNVDAEKAKEYREKHG
jgi:hypothetical protein